MSYWHHIVLTYESGSSTGIKLYVDGDLKDTEISSGSGSPYNWNITGSNDFTSSHALRLGGDDHVSGNGAYFNGFLQYPKVYKRVLADYEVLNLYNNPSVQRFWDTNAIEW